MDTAVSIFLSSIFFIKMSFIFDRNVCRTIFRIEELLSLVNLNDRSVVFL